MVHVDSGDILLGAATVSYSRTARVLKQLEHPKLVNMKFLNTVQPPTVNLSR